MILILAIIIIVVLLCLDKEEKDKITAEENKIVGYPNYINKGIKVFPNPDKK